ncbi:putative membrane protein YphA (DoxX/SURF4 family) [Bacillus ectoiniformans]|uniref:TrkA C-terminal domain-containing protein n=1 Tax=Bacillus ectoiniformans TaxID=1494429 RepID=UPI001EF887BB|nr:TrkA C-terminal domain-containing protein [Bacillus ectoiniformans]MBM7647652.1 putative membrane protein YphA (DoxX/SURF4 family) [Bacillus ectoiniformans]
MFLYLLIVALVIEISVVLFRITGLKTEISRYQVISMLTGTGFTTDESQLIIDHPARRRISAFLILFGAFSLAVIISAITNIISNDLRLKELTLINLFLLLLLLAGKTPFIRNKLKKMFKHEMRKNLDISELPINEALYLCDDDIVTTIDVGEESTFIGKKVCELFDHEEDINLLFIKRGTVNIRSELRHEEIREGDSLYLYGDQTHIEKKFGEKNESSSD